MSAADLPDRRRSCADGRVINRGTISGYYVGRLCVYGCVCVLARVVGTRLRISEDGTFRIPLLFPLHETTSIVRCSLGRLPLCRAIDKNSWRAIDRATGGNAWKPDRGMVCRSSSIESGIPFGLISLRTIYDCLVQAGKFVER